MYQDSVHQPENHTREIEEQHLVGQIPCSKTAHFDELRHEHSGLQTAAEAPMSDLQVSSDIMRLVNVRSFWRDQGRGWQRNRQSA